MNPLSRIPRPAALVSLALLAAACGAPETQPPPRTLTAAEGRALVARHLPTGVADRNGWAMDIYAAIAALRIDPTPQNACAVIAVTEQESNFQADPVVPNLGAIASKALEREREKLGIPRLVLEAALLVRSTDGRSYRARIDAARTERELSEVFDDFVDRVPLGKRFLADRNPVRTGGPMQVSVAYAQAHAARTPYPYSMAGSVRQEVFSRRGGIYFGTAHLLDYPASYGEMIYRFADFNAGHYASRNAAFQKAVSDLTGIPLVYDGDLVRFEHGRIADKPGSTELALRVLGPGLRLDDGDIRDDLEHGQEARFEKTRLYRAVLEAADASAHKRVPRAMLPRIDLAGPKITRKFTTEAFARRVDRRYRACLARGGA
jgi:hypothetical protein